MALGRNHVDSNFLEKKIIKWENNEMTNAFNDNETYPPTFHSKT